MSSSQKGSFLRRECSALSDRRCNWPSWPPSPSNRGKLSTSQLFLNLISEPLIHQTKTILHYSRTSNLCCPPPSSRYRSAYPNKPQQHRGETASAMAAVQVQKHRHLVGVVVNAGARLKTIRVRVPAQKWNDKIKKVRPCPAPPSKQATHRPLACTNPPTPANRTSQPPTTS
jgi:hypothetical protein